jgi:hypothetical protein
MWEYRQWLNQPPDEVPRYEVDRESVRQILADVRASERVSIGEAEAGNVPQLP